MKIIISLIVIFLNYNFAVKIKETNSKVFQSNDTEDSNKKDKESIWSSLFNNYDERKCSERLKVKYGSRKLFTNNSDIPIVLPEVNRKTTEKYNNKKGYGEVSYLFDYLDDIFQNEITSEFSRIWEMAKKIEIKQKLYEDPYDTDKILTAHNKILVGNSLGFDAKIEHLKIPQDEFIKRMKKITPYFNYTIYMNSLNAKQIDALVTEWSYDFKYATNDLAKYLIDKYDMDGDGRLNVREFILLSIHHNKNISRIGECKNCYGPIVKKKIDPIYDFIDCEGSDLISTKDICEGFSFLKRKEKDKFDMFKCKIKEITLRTASCNDFVLKNSGRMQGHVNKVEFREGLLLGYWDRQTDAFQVYSGDEINNKFDRWSNIGDKDLFCDTLNLFK